MLRLIEMGYWPATPTRPVLAFTRAFMDWMETLLFECQVSAQDISCAIELMVKEKFIKVICFLVIGFCSYWYFIKASSIIFHG